MVRSLFSSMFFGLCAGALALAHIVMVPIAAAVIAIGKLFVAYVPRPIEGRRDMLARFALVASNRNKQMASFAF